jgi:hypothetical protein
VSRAHLPRTSGGNYDLVDPAVWSWVTEPAVESALDRMKRTEGSDLDDAEREQLEKEKIKWDIIIKKKTARDKDREHKIAMKELVPAEVIALWIGYFAAGIRNNFLPIGNRVARGNTKLRDRIESEIKKAIEKTKSNAADQLRRESEKLIEGLEE